MNPHLDTALSTDLDTAVRDAQAAAVNAAFAQAQKLLGDPPQSRADAHAHADADGDAEDWNVAVQVLAFRIEHAAGFDALGSVLGLRRWGVTWDVIGRAAGISRQAAHARWGAQVRATLDRYGTGELGGPVADDEGDLAPSNHGPAVTG